MILRPPRIEGDACLIPLTKGLTAIVDVADADLGQFNWNANQSPKSKSWYAKRHVKLGFYQYRKITLHQEIASRMGLAIDGDDIDHIDGNGLNNRRDNLRRATRGQNIHNSGLRSDNKSGHKGVGRDAARGKWLVQMRANGKNTHLGRYDDLELAAFVYEEAAAKQYGAFVCGVGRTGAPR